MYLNNDHTSISAYLISFFVFHIEVPAMHDPIPSIINITNKQLNNQLFQGQHFCFKDCFGFIYWK